MWASAVTRSTGERIAWPREERPKRRIFERPRGEKQPLLVQNEERVREVRSFDQGPVMKNFVPPNFVPPD